MAAPKKVDYARVEPAWRAGVLSPPQLAAEYTEATGIKVSHTAIIKHFKKLGVPRDLAAKVKAKADAMVLEAMVTGKVSAIETTRADAEIINDGATKMATIQLAHRKDIARLRALAGLYEQELEQEYGKTDEAKQRLPLSAQVKVLGDLASTLRTLIGLEREAFGISGAFDPGANAAPAEFDTDAKKLEGARRIAFILAQGNQILHRQPEQAQ